MFRSLYSRLAIVLLALFFVVGVAFVFIARFTMQMFYQEITQRLNASIAGSIVKEQPLLVAGQVDTEAVRELAHHVMVINPSAEVYLLDREGEIIAHAAPPGSVVRQSVALDPVRRFVSGESDPPIAGDDPRSPLGRKVFSAAPVQVDGEVEGYVYVILGGQMFDALVERFEDSYILKLGAGAVAVSLAFAALAGLLIFAFLTNRLRNLTLGVEAFRQAGFDADQSLTEVSGSGDEIDRLATAFNAMADRIRMQFDRLREADQTRRELMSNVSHDLRTPLASMQGYIETVLLKNGELEAPERRRYLEIAAKHGVQVGELIDELFALSKLDAGTVNPAMESFSLSELLQDVGQEFELRASEKSIRLEIAPNPESGSVYADIGLIQRVLENLIDNALRYTPAGGTVALSISHHADSVGITIKDTGCGIPEEDLPHVFDRFYRAAGGDTRNCMGLGLAIVKRILELHGSDIHVTSAPGRGSAFSFRLPVAAPA